MSRYLCLLRLVLLGCLLSVVCVRSAEAGSEGLPTDTSLALYMEALMQLKHHALQPLTTQQIVRNTLKAYLHSLDPFSEYFFPDEYATYRVLQQPQYAGVGMDLVQTRSGQIVCFPYPGSPASQAGLVMGDVLQAVDGVNVAGQSVLLVGTKLRGEAGRPVQLQVIPGGKGGARNVLVIRTALLAKTVFVEERETVPIVRLFTFTAQTPSELLEAFSTLRRSPAVVLDLRGNTGGSLQDAIAAAELFLGSGQRVVSIQTQAGRQEFRSQRRGPITVPIYLWQDTWTASAAEVFIGALCHHQRAVSLGKKTFGKGTMQQIFELTDGSALLLTTGYLQTPDGVAYHNQGLEPTYPLLKPAPDTRDYLAKMSLLLKQQKKVGRPAVPSTKPLALGTSDLMSDTLAETHLVCFDKDFANEVSAQAWSGETQASLKEHVEFYTLQRKKTTGILYVVCIGPFRAAEEAIQQQTRLAATLHTAMFTTVVGQASFGTLPSK